MFGFNILLNTFSVYVVEKVHATKGQLPLKYSIMPTTPDMTPNQSHYTDTEPTTPIPLIYNHSVLSTKKERANCAILKEFGACITHRRAECESNYEQMRPFIYIGGNPTSWLTPI